MKVRLMALLFALSLVLVLPLAASAGPTAGGTDSDLDGVEDAFDNCTFVANDDQVDADHDGCGDACTQPITCDANGDTAVGVPDFITIGGQFGNQVGESGITTAQCNPALCLCTPQ